ncbi:hypothetical protein AAU61_11410 [Desulfocarbo indianensis]|nr:hypothetical protein AAU61_11410 [Desulfocarbo indianensis]
MVDINKTELATSDPLDLCKGFAIFPSVGAVRAGISSGDKSATILHKSASLIALKGSFSFAYEVLMGVCGPSYAVKFDLEGSGTGKNLDLTVSNDAMWAGFFVGITVQFPMSASVQYWKPDHWYSPWKGHWHDLGSFNITPKIDLLGVILFAIIKILGADSNLAKINNFLPGLIGSWGFTGTNVGGFAANDGTMTAKPVMNIPINIIPLIPALGEIDEACNKIGLKIASGPNIGISVPVHTSLTKVDLDGNAYENLQWNSSGFTASGSNNVPSSPSKMTVQVTHTPDLTFLIGWFASASLFKLFSISATLNLDVLGLLGITIQLGTYNNNLSNTVGQLSVDSCDTCGAQQTARPMRVIFEDPQALEGAV